MYICGMVTIIGTIKRVIDAGGGVPIYRLVADAFAGMIANRELKPGDRLPTSRHLAAELGLHRNTINRVFEELNGRGLVESTVGKGTFVSSTGYLAEPELASGTIPWNALTSSVANAEPLSRFRRLSRFIGGEDYINLSRMHPSNELIPSELIRRSTDAVIKQHGADALGYGPPQGLSELRHLISIELGRASIPAREEEVIITTGSQQALDLVARMLCDPGDTVLMEEHSYSGAINAFTSIGARIRPLACDEHGPKMNALEAVQQGSIKALYLMPSCSNPTGRTISQQRRQQLLQWSAERGVPIIEDDYGADLDDEGLPPAMRSGNGDVLYLGTFSKKLAPALRVGFIIAPTALVPRIVALKQSMDLGTSLLQQYVLAEFISRGYLRSHLRKIQTAYHQRRITLAAALRQHLPEGVQLRVPEAGVLMWLRLPDGMNSEELFREALQHGVLVSPGVFHSVSPMAASGVRLTFCAESEDRLAAGGKALAEAITALADRMEQQQTVTQATSLDGV